jgi:hypothetical protein
MTTPNPCSLKQVAAELGISSVNLYLNDSRVRALAGVPSGVFGLKECAGKSAYTPMSPNIGSSQGASDSSGGHAFVVTVAPNGGIGPYTYFWNLGGISGGGASITAGQGTATATYVLTQGTHGNTTQCQANCVVTDSLSNAVTSNTITLTYTLP